MSTGNAHHQDNGTGSQPIHYPGQQGDQFGRKYSQKSHDNNIKIRIGLVYTVTARTPIIKKPPFGGSLIVLGSLPGWLSCVHPSGPPRRASHRPSPSPSLNDPAISGAPGSCRRCAGTSRRRYGGNGAGGSW